MGQPEVHAVRQLTPPAWHAVTYGYSSSYRLQQNHQPVLASERCWGLSWNVAWATLGWKDSHQHAGVMWQSLPCCISAVWFDSQGLAQACSL